MKQLSSKIMNVVDSFDPRDIFNSYMDFVGRCVIRMQERGIDTDNLNFELKVIPCIDESKLDADFVVDIECVLTQKVLVQIHFDFCNDTSFFILDAVEGNKCVSL